jgi:hypothetical protein
MKDTMKKIILSLFILLIFSSPARAQMGMMGSNFNINGGESTSINETVARLLSEQNVSSASKLDCGQISQDELETLGDSIMSLMHPNQSLHQTMDTMMGGEGSDSLRTAHVNMALNYLNCSADDNNLSSDLERGWPIFGMMNYRNLGTTFKDLHQFDPANWHYNLHLILINITWIAIVALIIAATRYLWQKADKK